jgi:hypothetical protein
LKDLLTLKEMFEGPIAASSDYADLLFGGNWQEISRHKEIL